MDEDVAIADAVPDGRAIDVGESDGLPMTNRCLRWAPWLQGLVLDVAAESVLGQRLYDLLPVTSEIVYRVTGDGVKSLVG